MRIFFFFVSGLLLTSCKKFVQVDPPANSLTSLTQFSNAAGVTSAFAGIYSNLSLGGFASGDVSSVTCVAGMSADELISYTQQQDYNEFYVNSLSSSNPVLTLNLWGKAYEIIYATNSIIQGVNASSGLTAEEKTRHIAEAKFIRAFCYFYLLNLWGDVPLITSTDYQTNADAPRTPIAQIYLFLINELTESIGGLPNDYSVYSNERGRPVKSTAQALLARIYLFHNDWQLAEAASAEVLGNALYGLENDLDKVFLKNSAEAIWQLIPVFDASNTNDAISFILTEYPNTVVLQPSLISSFELGDQRKIHWINSIFVAPDTFYFSYKYKVKFVKEKTEYSMVFRLAEQYLIHAEAKLHLNDLVGGVQDINIIRHRAGLADFASSDTQEILAMIKTQRRVELFTEWGHRWLDLKRYGDADAVLDPIKGTSWQPTDMLYPIPQVQLINGKNNIQNPGY